MTHIFRLGTRASGMAVAMAEDARNRILQLDRSIPVNIAPFVSEGCRTTGDLKDIGGKGLFVKDLERRLLFCEIDCAIHALKDVPSDRPMHPALTLIAFLEREDPRDALILRSGVSEDQLPRSQIGTSAPRRAAILSALYPGVGVKAARGNADTRIRNLDAGLYDAVVLSAGGLNWLGLAGRIARFYDPGEMLPAAGQGIVCLQIRRSDAQRFSFLRELNDPWTEVAATVERSVISHLEGNCHSAIAAHCSRLEGRAVLNAMLFDKKSQRFLRAAQEFSLVEDSIDLICQQVANDIVRQRDAPVRVRTSAK